ncbi:MAG: AraC-like DNA-binding protein [Flavobacteriales bacterium]|jgi:AraC-like DNA-binding protein
MPLSSSYLILAAAVGIISLSAAMLIARIKLSQAYAMLGLFLLSGACANTLPLVTELWPDTRQYALAIVIPAYFAQPIFLWLYVKGLCSPTQWRLRGTSKHHMILPILSLVYAVVILLAPSGEIAAGFDGDKESISPLIEGIFFTTFLLMLAWIGLSCVYLVFIIRRLLNYRRALKQLFASTDQVELGWLLSVIVVIALAWCAALVYLILGFNGRTHLIEPQLLASCYFALVWVLSFWGLRQKPGFHDRYIHRDDSALEEVIKIADNPASTRKYARSGLDKAACSKIAERIENAMRSRELYLDPTLSLSSLSTELSVVPNYVSQALNAILEHTFFDYINKWRVAYSQPLIRAGEQSVLDIALASGFNSRSSFYKAFKKETGKTPTEYKAT